MKQYLSKIILAFFVIVLFDQIIGFGLEKFYFTASSGAIHQTTYAIEKANEDVLILGTSRARYHYNTKVIEDSTGLSVYNLGSNGNFTLYQNAILKSVTKRHTPKAIILDFSDNFNYNPVEHDRLALLLPYYKKHPEIQEVLSMKSPYEKWKMMSKIYPFNSRISSILMGNLELNKKREKYKDTYKGYKPLERIYELEIDSLQLPNDYAVNDIKYDLFKEIISICKKKNIQLVVVVSPAYFLYENNYSIELCKKLCEDNNVAFIDYSRDEEYLKNKALFADVTHLNKTGSTLFTSQLMKKLKQAEFFHNE
jgi:hypothetical protein